MKEKMGNCKWCNKFDELNALYNCDECQKYEMEYYYMKNEEIYIEIEHKEKYVQFCDYVSEGEYMDIRKNYDTKTETIESFGEIADLEMFWKEKVDGYDEYYVWAKLYGKMVLVEYSRYGNDDYMYIHDEVVKAK